MLCNEYEPVTPGAVPQASEPSFTNRKNRRLAQRFEVRIPLTLRVNDREYSAVTRDLSVAGVFFFLAEELGDISDNVEFLFTFPPEMTLSTSRHVRCVGRIVRRGTASKKGEGFAAQLRDCEFFAPAQA